MKSSVYQAMYKYEKTHWWYRVRRKIVIYFIQKYSKKNIQKKILDIGCGTGWLMSELSSVGNVYGVDFSDESVAFCKQRGIKNVAKGDIVNLPLYDNSFDVVLALDVLEHIEDDKKAFFEVMRVLKPGGIAVIFVPAFMFLWGNTDYVSEHKRRYTKSKLLNLLHSERAEVLRITYFNFILFVPILIIRLFVRFTKIIFINEYKPGTGFMNNILYMLFNFEVTLLRFLSFPFGVSILTVCRK